MGSVRHIGTREAAFVPHPPGTATDELAELVAQARQALVHPVLFGSAITGAGVDALTSAVVELLPVHQGDGGGPASGTVFKVERGRAGEKIAYVRMFSGTLRTSDKVHAGTSEARKVTAIRVFERGADVQHPTVAAGQIAKLPARGPRRHDRARPSRAGAAARRPHGTGAQGASYVLEGHVPAGRVHELQQRLPGLTRGEGVLECSFDHHAPVHGPGPARPRSDHNRSTARSTCCGSSGGCRDLSRAAPAGFAGHHLPVPCSAWRGPASSDRCRSPWPSS